MPHTYNSKGEPESQVTFITFFLWKCCLIQKDDEGCTKTTKHSLGVKCCWKFREYHAAKQTVHVRFHFCWYFCNQKFTVLISRNMAVNNVKKKCSVQRFQFTQWTYSCKKTQHIMTFVDNFSLPKTCSENIDVRKKWITRWGGSPIYF